MAKHSGNAKIVELKPGPISAAKAHMLLANEIRREVLISLGECPKSVGTIAAELDLDSQTISRGLSPLRKAGLVVYEKVHKTHVYRLTAQVKVDRRDSSVVIEIVTGDGTISMRFDLRSAPADELPQ